MWKDVKALLIFAVVCITSFVLVAGVLQQVDPIQAVGMSENCYQENYGYCSESLCWDYDKDVEGKDIACGKLAKQLCTDKISSEDFKTKVEELSLEFYEETGE